MRIQFKVISISRVEQAPTFNVDKPISLVYLTSCRELRDEGIGRDVKEYGRRQGTLEAIIKATQDESNPFSKLFELKRVIIDDTEKEFLTENFSTLWDLSLSLGDNGSTLGDLIQRVPSNWRKIAVMSIRDPEEKTAASDRKDRAKTDYEQQLIDLLRTVGADLLISDSYKCKIGPTLLTAFGRNDKETGYGRILNIHPALIDPKSKYQLLGAQPTRDAYTRARYGRIIVTDKAHDIWPAGEVVDWTVPEDELLVEAGKTLKSVKVETVVGTGVTVHVIDEKIDHGVIVLAQKNKFKLARVASLEDIRERNYQIKNQLILTALLQYIGSVAIVSPVDNETP